MGRDHDTNHKCVRFIKKVTSNKSFWSSENTSITRVLLILIQLWSSTPEQVLDGQQVPQLSGSLLSTEKAEPQWVLPENQNINADTVYCPGLQEQLSILLPKKG